MSPQQTQHTQQLPVALLLGHRNSEFQATGTMTESVTQAEFARMANVNRSTVHRWIQSGRIETDARGRINPEAAARMREATESPLPHHQARKEQIDAEKAGKAAAMESRDDAQDSNRRHQAEMPQMEKLGAALKLETYKLQKAKAETANMELDKLAGILVERSRVDYVLADVGSSIRTMLENMPHSAASSLAMHMGDAAAIHAELERLASDLLNEMADLMRRKMEGITQ